GRGGLRRRLGDADVFLQLGHGRLVRLFPVAPRPGLGGLGADFRLRRPGSPGLAVRGQPFVLVELDVAVGAGHLALALGAVPGPALVAVAAPVAVSVPAAAAVAVPAPVAALLQVPVIGRLDVGDVQEAVAADAEVDERGLDARLDVDDAPLVDVVDVALVAGALDVQLL